MDNIPRLEQLLEYVTFQLHSYDTLLSVRNFNTRPIIPSKTMLSTVYSIANLFQLHWGIETTVVLFMFATYYLENKLLPEFMRPHHADVIEYLSSQPTICIFVALLIIASKFNFDRFIPLSYWSGALAIQTAELVDVERNLLVKFMYDFTIGTGGNREFEKWLGKLFEQNVPQTVSAVSTLKMPVMTTFAEFPSLGRYHNPTHFFPEPDVESEVCSYAKVGSKLTHWNRGPYVLSGGFIKVDAWGTDCPYGQGWVLANYIDCIPK
ncbi:hypothetical protein BKA69DRAFT_1043071 [Paraphysoderma sedebokerense]|nr:hypothetical protein BKA69DRAFT_1043071 [Paraphysoderma sedebokerense]